MSVVIAICITPGTRPKWGLKALVLTDTFPKWCAVPFASKSRTFSHSLGRLLPFAVWILNQFERLLLVKAVAQLKRFRANVADRPLYCRKRPPTCYDERVIDGPQLTQSGVRQAKLAKDKEMKVLHGERSSQPPRPRVMRRYS